MLVRLVGRSPGSPLKQMGTPVIAVHLANYECSFCCSALLLHMQDECNWWMHCCRLSLVAQTRYKEITKARLQVSKARCEGKRGPGGHRTWFHEQAHAVKKVMQEVVDKESLGQALLEALLCHIW